jgi:hypothetical protein
VNSLKEVWHKKCFVSFVRTVQIMEKTFYFKSCLFFSINQRSVRHLRNSVDMHVTYQERSSKYFPHICYGLVIMTSPKLYFGHYFKYWIDWQHCKHLLIVIFVTWEWIGMAAWLLFSDVTKTSVNEIKA